MGIPWMYPDPHVYPDKTPAGSDIITITHVGTISSAETQSPYAEHAYNKHETPGDKLGPLVPHGSAAFFGDQNNAPHVYAPQSSVKAGTHQKDYPSLGLATTAKSAADKIIELAESTGGPAGLLLNPAAQALSPLGAVNPSQTTHVFADKTAAGSVKNVKGDITDNNPNAIKLTSDMVPRSLPQRSFLKFIFSEGGTNTTTAILPFFEDVKIKESKKANYAKYNPLARSSQLYAYTGADSRKISLEFSITAPHIFAELNKISTFLGKDAMTQRKELFFAPLKTLHLKKHGARTTSNEYLDIIKQFAPDVTSSKINNLSTFDRKMLNYILELTNLIRASVINNSQNQSLGPPIVRLNHGILYRDVPCIATDYSLDYPTKLVGHDLKTLMPRRINVKLSLEEVRVGDFKEFSPSVINARDNIAGWEAIFNSFEGGTLDPQPLPTGT